MRLVIINVLTQTKVPLFLILTMTIVMLVRINLYLGEYTVHEKL